MLHFSKCLGTVFARQVPINVAFFTMPWAWFLQDRFWSVIWLSLDTCVYTFEKEFSTSILHMRPIGFKSSAYYTQKWNKTWSLDLSLFLCTIYFMVENSLYLNVAHW
jgi:hypothetical protein